MQAIHTTNRTAVRYRQVGDWPPYFRVGRRLLYREVDVDEWERSSTFAHPVAEAAAEAVAAHQPEHQLGGLQMGDIRKYTSASGAVPSASFAMADGKVALTVCSLENVKAEIALLAYHEIAEWVDHVCGLMGRTGPAARGNDQIAW
jgi:hypothetical protein